MASSKGRRGPVNASDLVAQLNADPEYQQRKAEFDRGLKERSEVLRRAEQPIVRALRDAGYDVSSVWDLLSAAEPYPEALPVLLEHLQRGGYPDRVMESLGRAVAVRSSSFAWQTLRELYLRANGRGEEEGLALALSVSATKEHLDALIELLGEEPRGESRIHFLRPIKRLGGERGLRVIESLLDHPLLGKEAAACLRKARARRAQ